MHTDFCLWRNFVLLSNGWHFFQLEARFGPALLCRLRILDHFDNFARTKSLFGKKQTEERSVGAVLEQKFDSIFASILNVLFVIVRVDVRQKKKCGRREKKIREKRTRKANMSGVSPSERAALMSAPYSRSKRATSKCSNYIGKVNGWFFAKLKIDKKKK